MGNDARSLGPAASPRLEIWNSPPGRTIIVCPWLLTCQAGTSPQNGEDHLSIRGGREVLGPRLVGRIWPAVGKLEAGRL